MALVDAGSSPEHVPRPRRLRLDLTTPTLLSLPLAWLAVFFLVPIAIGTTKKTASQATGSPKSVGAVKASRTRWRRTSPYSMIFVRRP